MLDKIALLLVIIGAINWGSIGIFSFDIVAWICGGQNRYHQPHYLYVGCIGGYLVHFAFLPQE